MPIVDKEKKKEYDKNYYLKNKIKFRNSDKKYKEKNRELLREKNAVYRKNNPSVAYLSRRKAQLKMRFNISLNEYDNLLDKQGGVCKICKTKESRKVLCVDHNHNTGKIRGLLCSKCNRGIGLLGDNIDLLKVAIKYLSN